MVEESESDLSRGGDKSLRLIRLFSGLANFLLGILR